MVDPFLDAIFVSNAIAAAFGRNSVYASSCTDSAKQVFREKFAERLRAEARRYATKVTDGDHCVTIGRIADALSAECPAALRGGRLRYGTAQKAFNLYLKFLWRSNCIPEPPHCPIDRVVLSKAGVKDLRTGGTPSWTDCDCIAEYRRWIDALRSTSNRLSLAQWEHNIWLDGRRSGE
jgi:hypothetical protein